MIFIIKLQTPAKLTVTAAALRQLVPPLLVSEEYPGRVDEHDPRLSRFSAKMAAGVLFSSPRWRHRCLAGEESQGQGQDRGRPKSVRHDSATSVHEEGRTTMGPVHLRYEVHREAAKQSVVPRWRRRLKRRRAPRAFPGDGHQNA